MTEERLSQITEAHREIEAAAEALLARYNAIINEYGFNEQGDNFGQHNAPNFHVNFSQYDEGVLEYTGYETWAYGGHESYAFELPASYLTNNDWETELRTKCQAKVDAANLHKRQVAEATERRERELLASLQEKYTKE